jgi:hypothetical protein
MTTTFTEGETAYTTTLASASGTSSGTVQVRNGPQWQRDLLIFHRSWSPKALSTPQLISRPPQRATRLLLGQAAPRRALSYTEFHRLVCGVEITLSSR